MILVERLFMFVHIIEFLQMGRWKIEETLKNNKNNSQIYFVQRILGRLICYTDFEEARRFKKDIYITLTKKRSSDIVEHHVQTTEE